MRRLLMVVLPILAACHPQPSAGALSGSGILTPATFQGMVVDRSTGAGLSGATVSLVPGDTVAGANAGQSVRTAGGEFQFAAVVPGRYAIEIDANGFRGTRTALSFSPGQTRLGHRYELVPVRTCPNAIVAKRIVACP